MRPDWLWDRDISMKKIQSILKDPQNVRFTEIAALLLSRKNTPKEVFDQYLEKEIFVQHWVRIKRRMRKNAWSDPRIDFWQAVYEKIVKAFKDQGVPIRPKSKEFVPDEVCQDAGNKIKNMRQSLGMTQAELAQRLGVSQQIISLIETGRENPSIKTISTICQASGGQAVLTIVPTWMEGKVYSEQSK